MRRTAAPVRRSMFSWLVSCRYGRKKAFGKQHDGAVDHLAVDADGSATGRSRSLDDAACPRELLLARRQRRMQWRDLTRVDAQLAAEAEALRALRIGMQAPRIVGGQGDAVDRRRQPRQPRRQRELEAHAVELTLLRIAAQAEVGLKIDVAEQQ